MMYFELSPLMTAIVMLIASTLGAARETETPVYDDIYVNSAQKGSTYDAYLWHKYDCDAIFTSPRPIHNASTWMLLRGAYEATVGYEDSSLPAVSHEHGFNVPFEAVILPKKGRGIIAADFIPNGELVWGYKQMAMFDNGKSYEWFLYSIPQDLACDVIQWAYVLSSSRGNMISVDLDEGSFINDEFADETKNVGCNREGDRSCEFGLFAFRDIEKGEEILCSYNDFHLDDSYSFFDTRTPECSTHCSKGSTNCVDAC